MISIEGYMTFFVVTRSGSFVEQQDLNSGFLMPSFSLPAGEYELRSYVMECERAGPSTGHETPKFECRASFKLKAGKTQYAVRNETMKGTCKLTISSSPPKRPKGDYPFG